MTMTPEELGDYQLLKLANERGKFALEIAPCPESIQFALERGIEGRWFTLVDVSPLAHGPPNRVFRVFKLTDFGWLRLKQVTKKAGPGRSWPP